MERLELYGKLSYLSGHVKILDSLTFRSALAIIISRATWNFIRNHIPEAEYKPLEFQSKFFM